MLAFSGHQGIIFDLTTHHDLSKTLFSHLREEACLRCTVLVRSPAFDQAAITVKVMVHMNEYTRHTQIDQ